MHIYDTTQGIDARLNDASVWTDPYPLYAKIREADGLVYCRHFGGEARLVTRYEDVATTLRDTDLFKNDPRNATGAKSRFDRFYIPKVVKAFARSMVFVDGLDHRRLRGLATKAFTPSRIQEMQAYMTDITQSLLDDVANEGTFDLIEAFALPLPLRIISEMLGVNEDERRRFQQMIHVIFNLQTGKEFLLNMPTFFGLYRFFKRLLKRKRKSPEDDLTSALIKAEEDGDQLTPEELMGTVFLLLFAGHETTVNLIGNGTLALLENPEQMERLRTEPTLLPLAIEEMLRYYSPAQMVQTRHVAKTCTLGGTELQPGELLVPFVGAANRDTEAFPNADSFDIGRDPNKHLAFGIGPHFCLGAHLSRIEGNIAFQALLERFSSVQLAVDRSTLRWRSGQGGLRGLETLPITVRT